MKFVSIDSSLANTGVAIGHISPEGVVKIDKIQLDHTEKTKNKQVRASSDTIVRCRQTYSFVRDIILKEKPQVIFVETPSGSQSASGMKSYGSTCMLIGSIQPAPIEVTPMEVKVASVGSKTASKADMIQWAYEKYPDLNWFWYQEKLQAKNEHMADAIGVIYAAMKTAEFSRLQEIYIT